MTRPSFPDLDVLLDLRAGQDYLRIGGTFSRSGEASYIDADYRLRYAPNNVLRDNHWVNGRRGWLLEPPATQICPFPQTPASWTSPINSGTVTPGFTDPWGGSAAVEVSSPDTVNARGLGHVVTFTGDGERAVLFAVRPGTASAITVGIRDLTASVNRYYVRVLWNADPTVAPTCSTFTGTGSFTTPVRVDDADGNIWWLVGLRASGIVAANQNRITTFVGTTSAVEAGTYYLAGANAWNSRDVYSWQPTSGHVRNRDNFFLPHGMTGGADYTVYTEGYAMQTARQADASYTPVSWWGITRTSPDWGLQLRPNGGAANRRLQAVILAPSGSGTQAVATENSSGKQVLDASPYMRAAVQVRGSSSPPAVAIGVRYDDEAAVWQTSYIVGDLSGTLGAWTVPTMRLGGYDANFAGVFLTRIRIVRGLQSLAVAALGVEDALSGVTGELVHFVELDFASGPVRLTTAAQDLDWNGQTWQAVGGALDISGVEETGDAKSQGVDLRLSGVDQSVLAVLLGSNYRGREAKVYQAYLDQTSGVVTGAYLLHQGLQLAPYTVDEERTRNGGTVRISTRLANYFGVRRVRGIQANLISHQHVHPGDTFFQHTAALANTKVYWATPVPTSFNRGGPEPVRAPPAYGG